MGKEKKFAKNFQGKDTFQRMNYLYQASHLLLATSRKLEDVSAYYGMLMSASSKRAVLRMAPEVKRSICKGCKVIVVPGVSARVRIKPDRVVWTCLRCGTLKRFPTKRGYKLWAEDPQACVEVLTDNREEQNEVINQEKELQSKNNYTHGKNQGTNHKSQKNLKSE